MVMDGPTSSNTRPNRLWTASCWRADRFQAWAIRKASFTPMPQILQRLLIYFTEQSSENAQERHDQHHGICPMAGDGADAKSGCDGEHRAKGHAEVM
jgi:hypothetical protein